MKRLSNDFRNITPGKSKGFNNTQMCIAINGKTPNKSTLNLSQDKRQRLIGEDVNTSDINMNKENRTQDNRNLKRLNSKKMLSTNIINKSIGNTKQKTPTNNISNNINIKKINYKIDDSVPNYTMTDMNDNCNNKKPKVYQFSKNDLLEAERELNLSNFIQMESNISDDLLLYNKEDEIFNADFTNKNVNLMGKFNVISTPQIKQMVTNLNSEDILDDKWDNFSKFLSFREIANLSLINKKIGKNSILSVIEELQRELTHFEEKVLSSVSNII